MSAALICVHRRLLWSDAIALNLHDWECVAHGAAPRIRLFEPASAVLSLGLRASQRPDAATKATIDLALARDLAVSDDDRGGLATLHLPGQLVALIAVPIARTQVPLFVTQVLAELATVCVAVSGRDVDVIADGPDIGLWSHGAKLASVGLRHREGVIRHGFALNVAVEPGRASGLTLCGRPTHELAQLQQPGLWITPHSIAHQMASAILEGLAQASPVRVDASQQRLARTNS